MAGPFPGMDPYLEDPVRWPGVHLLLIAQLDGELNRILPQNYVADVGERVYVEQSARQIYPDVFVRKGRRQGVKDNGRSPVALADPPWELELSEEEVHEPFITIIDITDKKRIVTAIEILSPTNKAAGTEGRKQYQKKQREALRSRTHFVEMDLLRHGEHTVHVSWPQLKSQGNWDYLVCCSRSGQRDRAQVWAAILEQRLPRILIPLSGKDPDVILDLQKVLNKVYEEGAYSKKINYRADPPEPLTKEQAKWADKLLKKHRLRA